MASKAVSIPKGAQYHCDYCRKDISRTIRIKCAHCSDFDLCVECFSVGVEIRKHKNEHPYYVMDQLNFPIIEKHWLASDELLLLEGIELYGMGNWDDISEHISTKTAEECKNHYFSNYIETPTYPVPDVSTKFSQEDIEQALLYSQNINIIKPNRKSKTQGSQPIDQDLAGYMPRRGEFEFEYDNDAEYLLTDMTFNDDDTPTERELKIASLHIYNKRIEKRVKNREFVVKHQLMDLKKMQQADRKRTKEEKLFYKKTKKLLQFIDKDELDDFIKDLCENEIKKQIDKLLNYRSKGIRSMADATNYESLHRRRETQARKQRRESSNIYGYPERSKERASRWLNRDKDINENIPVDDLDISNAPGFDLLSSNEKMLCESLFLFPSQYTMIKDTLIKEYLKTGHIPKSTARFLVKTDVNKTSQIFDFLQSSGWINT